MRNHSSYFWSLLYLTTLSYSTYASLRTNTVHAKSSNTAKQSKATCDDLEPCSNPHPVWQAGEVPTHKKLPTFSRKETQKHNTPNSLWLTYRHGVYDLSEFADEHPGSVERLLLATHSNHDLCDWWEQLGYHNVKDVHTLLEKYRIGNIKSNDFLECQVKASKVDPILREQRSDLYDFAFSYEPFIAETPIPILDKYHYTPTNFQYVRNHFPVPLHLDMESTFNISGIGVPPPPRNASNADDDHEDGREMQYKELFSLPVIERDIYLQCGGHRRSEYNKFGSTSGSKWNVGAIGNGKYRGVLLRDILSHIGVNVDELYNNGDTPLHVWFIGADSGPDGERYGISIPAYKALDPAGDVMIAFECNGQPLTHDHGYPARVIVPGWLGARSVKWIESIVISDKECDLKSYTKSYRMTKGFKQEMRDLPVNSAIHSHQNEDELNVKNVNGKSMVEIRGEAHSGDGRPIIRVDVSVDGGVTWTDAEILSEKPLYKKHWNWTKWTAEVDVSEIVKNHRGNTVDLEIVCRAMDISHNRQPESCQNDLVFNPKGYSANPYHRVKVQMSC